MPYTSSDSGIDADGKRQLGAELDALVDNHTLTMDQAMQTAQERGLTTGPGDHAYLPPGWQAAQDARMNADSDASARRSAAYQASRAGNPEGYTKESQEAWDAAHPLSEYADPSA